MLHALTRFPYFEDLAEELASLERQGLRRRLTSIEAINGAMVRIEGQEVVCWCSNDYLGLSTHPALAQAAAEAALTWGVGARASRLLAGTTSLHDRLEAALASWFGTEASIVYSSGYLANLGTLGALLGAGDAVFVDRLAHASLVDAARATRARFRAFHHNDPEHLVQLLAHASGATRRLIVTEGVFSMEGDMAPLSALLDIAEAHDALLYLDDAHGAFVTGASGRGTPEACGVSHARLLYMGTLGKALGCQGGFVAGSRTLIEYLHNRSRTFIYSTALALPIVAASHEALSVLLREAHRRQQLFLVCQRLAVQLDRPVASPIVPIVVGSTEEATVLAERLWEAGHWAPAIRPPTVPKGSARIRVSLSARHTLEQVDALASAVRSFHHST